MITRRSLSRVLFTLPLVASATSLPFSAASADTQPEPGAQSLSGTVFGPARGDQLHIMSFNVRFASDTPPNSWPERRPVLAALLQREQPTVIGTQEGLYAQLNDIQADLPNPYDSIGVGRQGGSRGEFMHVFYDSRRLAPLEFDHFWLSDTPLLIGSATWGNTVVRMVTWVRFADMRTGREFIFLNTHFDHRSEEARQRSAGLIRSTLEGFPAGTPLIVTGDFNTFPETSVSWQTLTEGGFLADTWLSADEQVTPYYGTFHGFNEPDPEAVRIDWILTSQGIRVPAAAINTFRRGSQWPSDHLPVQALVELA
ncbi:endonuclease/exonuclease/phosphatase family protein [Allonocardiopsis opalescens]|uniref:Endonuclease/exonuclease/phosphatase family metal-dependent hydrolase n=1 Tax=Allonocardiopsis opalescens TaxID=1144618 RepID=A0A2T0PZY2_9ACTN|nr:endonuclease/exonuclease/phosphatase family protein [Allonocardiopsis opalescens]PRX97111.1 endonuclease/exonuclease/phosphatase family metal-dependent hydrolase [Allonocardiopsis opalescens]